MYSRSVFGSCYKYVQQNLSLGIVRYNGSDDLLVLADVSWDAQQSNEVNASRHVLNNMANETSAIPSATTTGLVAGHIPFIILEKYQLHDQIVYLILICISGIVESFRASHHRNCNCTQSSQKPPLYMSASPLYGAPNTRHPESKPMRSNHIFTPGQRCLDLTKPCQTLCSRGGYICFWTPNQKPKRRILPFFARSNMHVILDFCKIKPQKVISFVVK